VNKGITQGLRGDTVAAVATCDDVLARFASSDVPEVQHEVAWALALKGITQGMQGDAEAEIATYDEVVARFASSDVPEVQSVVAMALVNKGITQGRRGDAEAAIAASDEVLARFASSEVPEVQRQVSIALVTKGTAQAQFGSAEEALATWATLEREFGALVDEEAISFSWHAGWGKMDALMAMGKPQEAISIFHSVYASFEPSHHAMMRVMLERVPALVRAGISGDGLLDVLLTDDEKAAALAPLAVALRQRAGEDVRAPAEVLEVASDIRSEIERGA
jgi:tetratricopeptide (TPR) repeat protein